MNDSIVKSLMFVVGGYTAIVVGNSIADWTVVAVIVVLGNALLTWLMERR